MDSKIVDYVKELRIDRTTREMIDKFCLDHTLEPIYISAEDHRQLATALACIEQIAYSATTPDKLRENLIAVLDIVYPRILIEEQ